MEITPAGSTTLLQNRPTIKYASRCEYKNNEISVIEAMIASGTRTPYHCNGYILRGLSVRQNRGGKIKPLCHACPLKRSPPFRYICDHRPVVETLKRKNS
ncbi:unnamed protein product [Protopolystoma xenopodis]|uniref:Uncharacterized protein n=1 Tax=Protopolystoma xenopodis TaxID=117903 RepID=A0A3S5AN53_9PLAT|nr:unnamed protein product [Protopolystoma xenopodis]